MKKIIAKFLQFLLFRLGYTEVYQRKNEITIYVSCDSEQAIKEIKNVQSELELLCEKYKGLKNQIPRA